MSAMGGFIPSWWRHADRHLRLAILISLGVHAVILAIRFTPVVFHAPDTTTLDVIIVNSKSDTVPLRPDALAQVALDGGGDQAQGRAQSPLPKSAARRDGDQLSKAQAKLQALEAKQKAAAAQASRLNAASTATRTSRTSGGAPSAADSTDQAKPSSKETPQTANDRTIDPADLMASAREIARLEAQVSRQISDYNKRPRKHFFSPSTSPYVFAMYEESWRQKVERLGNLNYPEEARGKTYGQLRLTVYIKADGSVDDIEIDKPSGYPVLDRAAMRIVRLAAPFAKFPPEMAKEVDVLAISRTWVFTNDQLETRGK